MVIVITVVLVLAVLMVAMVVTGMVRNGYKVAKTYFPLTYGVCFFFLADGFCPSFIGWSSVT